MKRSGCGLRSFLCIALAVLGCGGGSEIVVPPVPPETGITLQFSADTGDRSTAAALGWTAGIPGVTVALVHEDSANGTRRTFQGSGTGTLTIRDLPGGRYVVDAVRWLTDEERARLPAGDDAVGFLARIPLATTSASQSLPVPLVASRRRGLVISEFQGGPLEAKGTPEAYYFSGYLRLYNNADSVIYLDGLIVGNGLASQYDYVNFPCSAYAPYAGDPLGVWANYFHQLPGRGSDYPLAPGETAVLAVDAIDHRPLYPIGLDLREADFEFYAGGADVDNPSVPNAIDVGLRPAFLGHGLTWSVLGKVAWIARSFDVRTVHTEILPGGNRWARIPASVLLDVMAIKTTYDAALRECAYLVHPRFDRQEAKLLGVPFRDDTLAYRRLQVPFTIGSRPRVQHTRTSAWDFTAKRRDPLGKP